MKRPKAVGIGELLWDVLPGGKRPGGAPLNFSFYAKELGAGGGIVSAIGEDLPGDELLAETLGLGIDASAVQRNHYPTGSVEVELRGEGIPSYRIREDVAWDHIIVTEQAMRTVSDADAVCWGSLAQRGGTSCRSIEKLISSLPEDCLKVFDINIRREYFNKDIVVRSLEQADILKLNEDELPLAARMLSLEGTESDIVRQLISHFGLSYVIYTRGINDSLVMASTGGQSVIPTPRVEVTDTVGAGDAFTATFVTGLLHGMSMDESHRCAVDVSAFVCTCNGAIAPLPERIKTKFYAY